MFGLCYPMSTNYHFIIILRTRMFPYKGNYQYPRNARQCSMTSPLSFSQWQPMHAMNCGGFCFWDISVDDSIEDADPILPRSLVCSWLIIGFFSLFSGIQCKHPLNLILYIRNWNPWDIKVLISVSIPCFLLKDWILGISLGIVPLFCVP